MAFNNQTAAIVLGKAVTRDELHDAFNLVANRANWKFPVNCTVNADAAKRALIREAVIFFTGSVPRFHRIARGQYRVSAPGYYATIGA